MLALLRSILLAPPPGPENRSSMASTTEAMAAADASPKTISILSGSLKLLSTNTKPLLPVFLLSLIPCSLMLLSSPGPVNPLILQSLTMPYPADTTTADFFGRGRGFFDPRSYDVKTLSTVTICHLWFFLPIFAGIRSLSLICSGQQLPPITKPLSMASFLLTRLCVTLLDLANKFFIAAMIEQIEHSSKLFFIYIVPLLIGLYLPALFVLALVVAATEGRCGVSALRRAAELLVGRRGRWQTSSLLLFYVVINPSIHQIFNLTFLHVDGWAGPAVSAAVWVVQVATMAAAGMWALAAHVMFYVEFGTHRCGEEEIAGVEGGREKVEDEYSSLPGGDQGIHDRADV